MTPVLSSIKIQLRSHLFRLFLCHFCLSSLSLASGTNSTANNASNGSNYTSVSLIKDMTFIKVQITESSIANEILETTSTLRYDFVNLVDKYVHNNYINIR